MHTAAEVPWSWWTTTGMSVSCAASMMAMICSRLLTLAMVARNIHRIDAIVWKEEIEREQRESQYTDRDTTYKLAMCMMQRLDGRGVRHIIEMFDRESKSILGAIEQTVQNYSA